MWILIPVLLLVVALAVFLIIARKGRRLRTTRSLPPPAAKGFLLWSEDGHDFKMEITPPFYLGKDATNDVVLQDAHAEFEACIFYHNKRFAIQALAGSNEILVNDAETMAGYLNNGDQVRIAKRSFVFESY